MYYFVMHFVCVHSLSPYNGHNYIYLWCSLNVRSFYLVMLNILHIFLHNDLILDFESMLIVHFVSVESF